MQPTKEWTHTMKNILLYISIIPELLIILPIALLEFVFSLGHSKIILNKIDQFADWLEVEGD